MQTPSLQLRHSTGDGVSGFVDVYTDSSYVNFARTTIANQVFRSGYAQSFLVGWRRDKPSNRGGRPIAFDAAFDGKQSVDARFDQRRLALPNPKNPHVNRPSAARDGKVRKDGVVRDRAVLIADGRGLNAQCVAAVLFPAGSQ